MLLGETGTAGRVRGRLRRAFSREPGEPAWPFSPVAVTILVAWAVMISPWMLGFVTVPWDAKAHFLPQIQFLAQSIGRGESPFWAPFVFAGHPQIADPQAMIFSPPFLLLALVNRAPSGWAVDMTVFLVQLAGALSLALWFRDKEWHWAGAMIAGIAFAFGASMAWRIQHIGQVLSLCYLPMILLAVDRAIRLGSYRYGLAAGALAAFMLLGRDQVALLSAYVAAAYVVAALITATDRRATLRDAMGPLTSGAGIALAIVAVPLLLTALLAADSNRPSIDFEGAGRGSLHPALLVTSLIPQAFGAAYRMEDYWGPPSFAWPDTGLFIAQNMGQLYVGAVPILIAGLALFQGRLWDPAIRFFTIAFAVVLLYALGWYTPFFRLAYEVVPGVALYRRPADATFVLGALGAILCGYATHRLFAEPWQRVAENAIALMAAAVALTFFTAFLLALWLDRIGQLWAPLVIAMACVGVSAATIAYAKPRMALEPRPIALLLAAILTADLAYNNGPSTSSALPPATYDALDPGTRNETIRLLKTRTEASRQDPARNRRDRVEIAGLGFHWPNAALSHGVESTLGYNPLRLNLYSAATGAEDHVGLPDQRKFSPLFPSYRSTLADLLGLATIASGAPIEQIDKSLKPGDLMLLAQTPDAWIYENPRALPRVVFANRSIGVSFEEVLRTGRWPLFDPRDTVLLEGSGQAVHTSLGAAATIARSAIIERYSNTRVDIKVESPSGGWLVLHDPWQRWWFVEVDGKPAQLLRANVLFRAVEVPAGRHDVRFTFQPLRGALLQLSERR